jgi:hypothetical protein
MTALLCRRSNERPVKLAPASGRRTPAIAVLGFMVLGASGCGDGPTTTELPPPPKVTVSATEPARAEQGETLDVHILGEGFVDDAVVSWRRNGAADPLIVVEQVTFVSATELIASILVGADADVAEYDVVVRSQRISGEGLGARLFEVSSYTPISVLSAHPAEGKQGRTVDIRILGTGFLDDAVPTWERDGVADTLIVVDQVMFVSETELRATVKIDRETDLGSYDVSVRSKRKKGIGSEDPVGVGLEIFTVTPYEPLFLGLLAQGLWAGDNSSALAINNQGLVVGIGSILGPAFEIFNPVLWTEQTGFVHIESVRGGAVAVNEKGWIAGTSRPDPFSWETARAFFHEQGVTTFLEGRYANDPGNSWVTGLNEAGTIIGGSDSTGVVWNRDGNGEYGPAMALPLRVGDEWLFGRAAPDAINAQGHVVGRIDGGAVLWKAKSDGGYEDPIDLTTTTQNFYDAPFGINDMGWIVGVAGNQRAPAVWLPADYGTPVLLDAPMPLNTSVWPKFDPIGINNNGQVIGTTGEFRAYLLNLDASGTVTEAIELLPYDEDRPCASCVVRAHPYAINDHGWVVGRTEQSYGWQQGPIHHATLWRPEQ